MPLLRFQNQTYLCAEGETALSCLTRQGAHIPSSCQSGICQSCLLRAEEGKPTPESQKGLKPTLVAQNYFLACSCAPTGDMTVALPSDDVTRRITTRLVSKEPLNRDIMRLLLAPQEPLAYHAGQYIHLHRPEGLLRSYSLASLPQEDLLELHVRKLPGGAMSEWLCDDAKIGEVLEVSGPAGNAFYLPDRPEQSLLLVGTGSGLAPLWGVLRDALQQGHTGDIWLFHGSWNPAGLYLTKELQALERQYPQFRYTPCVDQEAQEGQTLGRVHEVALAQVGSTKGWRVYLCGHPEMVQTMRKNTFLAGAAFQDIYADPFVLSKPLTTAVAK